jgi:hypothetical protein
MREQAQAVTPEPFSKGGHHFNSPSSEILETVRLRLSSNEPISQMLGPGSCKLAA